MVDVAIIGAGPAGSACAYHLARAGHSVAILERTKFPRTKVCGEYLNAGAQAVLRDLGAADEVEMQANRIRGIRLHVQDERAELPFAAPAWSLPRATLDAVLLGRAQAAGAGIFWSRLDAIEPLNPRGLRLRFTDASGSPGSLEAAAVVGADGAGSFVARAHLGVKRRAKGRFALGGHYSGFEGLEGFIEMYVQRGSYFAVNPLGPDLANVMVIVEASKLRAWRECIDQRLSETAAGLAGGRRALDPLALVGKRVAIGPLAHQAARVARGGVYLAGDAAEFIDPFTGQGVYLALASAVCLARILGAQLSGRLSVAQAAHAYAVEHARLLRPSKVVARLVSGIVRNPWLARRAVANLRSQSGLAEALAQAVSGIGAMPSLSTLARLVA
ncbi:MAG: geranylgeranyl reductase family protein [Vulcanimicrobiaceae bacterium]